jgi:hypothetical protein
MFENRFRDHWNQHESFAPIAISADAAAFVACPVFAWPLQQGQTEFLYRLAFQQAQAQLAERSPKRIPAFSRN